MAGPILTGSYGEGGGMIRVNFTVPNLRDAKGLFRAGVQNGIQSWSRQAAKEMQLGVVENVQGSIIRRGVSTGRLLKVTADPKNIRSGPSGFNVGVPSFLDQSQAKYWRTLEEGSAEVWPRYGKRPMIGRELKGLWGGTIIGMRGDRALAGAPITRFGVDRAGKLIPSNKPGRGRSGIIKKEITPQHAYLMAYRDQDPGRRGQVEVNRLLRQFLRGLGT